MKVSACFTNYNRTELLFEAIQPFLTDNRIDEIVISDDCSDEQNYSTVVWKYSGIDKVKIYRNEKNIDCYFNKKKAVELAMNEWVFILDSDNKFSTSFIDVIFSFESWYSNIMLQPCFAKPHFNFTAYEGKLISKSNVSQFMEDQTFQTMLNACNVFVNKYSYLLVWDGSIDPVTSDSIFQNYNWLKEGNSIYVVPGLFYEHRVHEESHYKNNRNRTPRGFHESIVNKIKNLNGHS